MPNFPSYRIRYYFVYRWSNSNNRNSFLFLLLKVRSRKVCETHGYSFYFRLLFSLSRFSRFHKRISIHSPPHRSQNKTQAKLATMLFTSSYTPVFLPWLHSALYVGGVYTILYTQCTKCRSVKSLILHSTRLLSFIIIFAHSMCWSKQTFMRIYRNVLHRRKTGHLDLIQLLLLLFFIIF